MKTLTSLNKEVRPFFLSDSSIWSYPSFSSLPREASTLIFKIRSCTVRTDLKNKAFSAAFVLIFKIRSYSARSALKNKSARFSGSAITGCGGPEGYFSLAIIAFGAFGFIVSKYYYRLGRMDKRSQTP